MRRGDNGRIADEQGEMETFTYPLGHTVHNWFWVYQ